MSGQQEGRTAEQEEEHVGEPCPDRPDAIVHARVGARQRLRRVAGVARAVRGERDEQHDGGDADRDDGTLAQAARDAGREADGRARLRLRFGQVLRLR